ncbi:MAG: Gfo/Idh/MocA family protein [Planctomycetota bacterium]
MLKTGIIGIGKRGRQFLNSLSKLSDIEISFLCDKNEHKLREVEKTYKGVNLSISYTAAKDYLDCVIIATPYDTHFEIAKFFLENNIPVLLEKPSTVLVEETETLFNIAKKNNVHLQIGFSERYNPAYLYVKNLVNGTSKIFIEASRINQFSERTLKIDVILDLMIHDIDLILNLLNKEPVNYQGFTCRIVDRAWDFAKVTMYFDEGVSAECTANRISLQTNRTMNIYKEDTIYKLDFVEQSLTIYSPSCVSSSGMEKYREPGNTELDNFVQIRKIAGEYRNLIVDEFNDFRKFITHPDIYDHRYDLLTLRITNKIKDILARKHSC